MFPPINEVHKSESFFNDYITSLYEKVSLASLPLEHSKVLNNDLSFNWNQFDQITGGVLNEIDIGYEARSIVSEVGTVLDRVAPVIKLVSSEVQQTDDLVRVMQSGLWWVGPYWSGYLQDAVRIATENVDALGEEQRTTRVILALLIFTSGLEHSLGNLLLTRTEVVPPLLKTLLPSEELEEMVGLRTIRMIKLVMGPPESLNLRNILWHGFGSPHTTIDLRVYLDVLLALLVTIGKELPSRARISHHEQIPYRPLWDFARFENSLKFKLPECHLELSHLDKMLHNSPLVHRALIPMWHYAFQLYLSRSAYSHYSFCLLMPLFEAALRYAFCQVNRISHRFLSAIAEEYYVTFTDMLVTSVGQTWPFDLLTEPLVLALVDTIQLPDGLCFRDRVSHGQTRLDQINPTVSNHVLMLVFTVLEQVDRRSKQLPPLYLPYQCLFHPGELLRAEMLKLIETERKLYLEVSTRQPKTSSSSPFHLDPFDALLSTSFLGRKVMFVDVERDNNLKQLRAIFHHLHGFTTNLLHFLWMREQELKQMKLRSRQRANYESLRTKLPHWLDTFASWHWWHSASLACIRLSQMTDSCHKDVLTSQIGRQMDQFLKQAQNLELRSSIKENKWDRVEVLLEANLVTVNKLREIALTIANEEEEEEVERDEKPNDLDHVINDDRDGQNSIAA